MESVPVYRKGLWISSKILMRTSCVFRSLKCRKDSWSLIHRDIINIGIMPRKKGIRELLYLQRKNRYFVTVYTPNSQNELARLPYRMKWEDDFLAYLKRLEENKPVIFCGDLNVAHKEIDLKNPKTNRKNAGFTDEERGKFSNLLEAGFVDTFRYFYPDQEGIYSWWSYRFSARAKNAGWRIDYFCVSDCLKERLRDAKILTDVMGSDHCPIELDFE